VPYIESCAVQNLISLYSMLTNEGVLLISVAIDFDGIDHIVSF